MTKVLVTGSSGQLGSFVCELLAKDGNVAGLDIRPQPHRHLKGMSLLGDITKPADVREALAGVEAVIHCAAQVSVEKSLQDPLSDSRSNVLGTVNLLHESVQAGVRKFIYVSSAAVYGAPKRIPIDEDHPTHPMSNYGVSKLSGEKYALAYAGTSSMEVVAVRPFNFYSIRADPESPYSGVITKFVNRLKARKPPIIEGEFWFSARRASAARSSTAGAASRRASWTLPTERSRCQAMRSSPSSRRPGSAISGIACRTARRQQGFLASNRRQHSMMGSQS